MFLAAAALLPLLAGAGGGDWPNVLDPLASWTFDLGSQVGFRAGGQPADGHGSPLTVAITGPVPDWAIPAGSRSVHLMAGAVPCSKLLPPFCSCAGGAGHVRNCSCSAGSGKCGPGGAGSKTCQICDNTPGPAPHDPLQLPVFTYGAQLSGGAAAPSQEAALLPGSVNVKRWDAAGSVEVSASLAFVSANTSVVNFTVRSLRTSGAAQSLALVIGGSSVKNATNATGGDGVNFELPGGSGGSCFQTPDFHSGGIRILETDCFGHTNCSTLGERWSSDAEQGSFSARSGKVSLPPGGSISTFITVTMGTAESCAAEKQRVAAVGVAAALTATRARWQRYLVAVLPKAVEDADLVKSMRWSAVKALMTLINNWRIVPGRGQGIIPSFVKYGGISGTFRHVCASLGLILVHLCCPRYGFLVMGQVSLITLHLSFLLHFKNGFDRPMLSNSFAFACSYKQAVATVIFDEALAKDQLRVITDARNVSSGHIPDLAKRCGEGSGAPGKPNLLSWAVMEIFNKTNDTAFLAEMFPIIEAFHHFVCESISPFHLLCFALPCSSVLRIRSKRPIWVHCFLSTKRRSTTDLCFGMALSTP